MTRIWDISQRLHPSTPVWPGDVSLQEERTWVMGDASPVNVASVRLSTHAGTHADAPLHYIKAGASIAEVSLEPYLGPCLVVDGRGKTDFVTWDDIKDQIDESLNQEYGDAPISRVLVRTFDEFPTQTWPRNFRSLGETVIDELADRGCILIGTDAPSIDPQESKDLPAHNAVAQHGLAILEGLFLDQVSFGAFELIALPLPFEILTPRRCVLSSGNWKEMSRYDKDRPITA